MKALSCLSMLAMILAGALLTACGKPRLKNAPPRNLDVCCFGDSLVSGVGAPTPEQSYPGQLADLIERQVTAWGRPGDTAGQALKRLEGFSQQEFGLVVVTLGGNDIIQRRQWADTEGHLREVFRGIQATGAVVAFTGVTGPLNPTRNGLYKKLCRQEGVLFIPEIMDGILANPELKADEIHPNAAGYRLIAERVAAGLREAGLVD